MRCLFFEVVRGGELRFVAGFGKRRDKLEGGRKEGKVLSLKASKTSLICEQSELRG